MATRGHIDVGELTRTLKIVYVGDKFEVLVTDFKHFRTEHQHPEKATNITIPPPSQYDCSSLFVLYVQTHVFLYGK